MTIYEQGDQDDWLPCIFTFGIILMDLNETKSLTCLCQHHLDRV